MYSKDLLYITSSITYYKIEISIFFSFILTDYKLGDMTNKNHSNLKYKVNYKNRDLLYSSEDGIYKLKLFKYTNLILNVSFVFQECWL